MLLTGSHIPSFLEGDGPSRLSSAREAYADLGLDRCSVVADRGSCVVFTWGSGRAEGTLIRLLTRQGLVATGIAGGIWCYQSPEALIDSLRTLPDVSAEEIAEGTQNLIRDKHDHLIPRSLLVRQTAHRDLDLPAAREVIRRILAEWDCRG